jgi:hypothetical protein
LLRVCLASRRDGQPCGATPTLSGYCFMHDPDRVEAAAEARELGGKRRRREGTIAGAFDFEGLDDVPKLRRLLEIIGVDLLGLENSIARARAIISLVQAAAKLLEVGEHEERLEAIEAVVGPRLQNGQGQQGRRSARGRR